MSPTVDDLLISLTIQKGSDLDSLRKQLNSLVGKDGKKKLDFSNIKDLVIIKKDVNFIRDKMKFLVPVVYEKSKTKIAAVANTLLQNLKVYGKGAIESATEVKPKHEKQMYKKYGIEEGNKEALLKHLEEGLLVDAIELLEAYADERGLKGDIGIKLNEAVHNLMFSEDGPHKLMALSQIENLLGEHQAEFEKIAEYINAEFQPQKVIYKLKQTALAEKKVQEYLDSRSSTLAYGEVTAEEKADLQKKLKTKLSLAESRSFIDVYMGAGSAEKLKGIYPGHQEKLDKFEGAFMTEIKNVIRPSDLGQVRDRVEKAAEEGIGKVLFIAGSASSSEVVKAVEDIEGAELMIVGGFIKLLQEFGQSQLPKTKEELTQREIVLNKKIAEQEGKNIITGLESLKNSADDNNKGIDIIIEMLKEIFQSKGIKISEEKVDKISRSF